MKKVALFATVLALAIGASAQASHAVPGPNAISSHVSANASGITTTQPAQAVSGAKSAVTSGAPPVAKQPPNAINSVAPNAVDNDRCRTRNVGGFLLTFCWLP